MIRFEGLVSDLKGKMCYKGIIIPNDHNQYAKECPSKITIA